MKKLLKKDFYILEQEVIFVFKMLVKLNNHLFIDLVTTWQKGWFVLQDGMLYKKKTKKEKEKEFEKPINILLCSVRIPISRKGTTSPKDSLDGETLSGMLPWRFEIVSPEYKKPLLFRVETEQERTDWMDAIQQAVSSNLTNQTFVSSPNKPREQAKLEQISEPVKFIKSIQGNQDCADCTSPGFLFIIKIFSF